MSDTKLREQLIEFLEGKGAHAGTLDSVTNFPSSLYASKPNGSPHNAWQLLEHIRFTLHDLLDFCTNAKYETPRWPEDYWPKSDTPDAPHQWKDAVAELQQDLEAFQSLVRSPETDLNKKIPWGDGQTILHEALLAIDHTSYHIGQLVMLRKQLDAWKD